MGKPMHSLLVLLAVAVLGACASARTIEVRAVPDGPDNVRIDEQHHKTVAVGPRNRVVWKCQCPPGTEFAIEEVSFATELDQLVEAIFPHVIKHPEKLDELIRELGPVSQEPTRLEDPGSSAAAFAERYLRLEGRITEAQAILEALRGTTTPPRTTSFEDQKPKGRPDGLFRKPLRTMYVDGARKIRSAPVARGLGNELWTFVWKVRLKGRPDTEVRSDPHIYTHPDISH